MRKKYRYFKATYTIAGKVYFVCFEGNRQAKTIKTSLEKENWEYLKIISSEGRNPKIEIMKIKPLICKSCKEELDFNNQDDVFYDLCKECFECSLLPKWGFVRGHRNEFMEQPISTYLP